jgi:RNA polymerase sigma-70 factor (ECF subfamily)
VADAFRQEWGRITAALIHQTGDWDLAEECAQDAFTQALRRWPGDGVPNRPGAWLMTVARNGAIDRLRRGSAYRAKIEEVAVMAARETGTGAPEPVADDSGVPDERLRLIFTCCHPALAMEARVALTLRTLTGLGTAEIARSFLVPEATMAKRLVRAKHKIANARIPYRVPPASALPQRVPGVLAVLYLIFNEGYSASTGDDLIRRDLCDRAVALTQVLAELRPAEPEAKGLLALMLFHRARQAARVNDRGDLVTLEDQDRTRWDQAQIGLARRHLEDAFAARRPGQRPGRLLPAARDPGRLPAPPRPERGSRHRLRGGGFPGRHRPRAPLPERTAGSSPIAAHLNRAGPAPLRPGRSP